MWTYIVRIILRNRLANLIIIGLLTAFFAYNGSKVKMSYEMAKMLPDSDSTSIEYKKFKEIFGEDGSVFFVGIQSPDLFELETFNDWYDLTYDLKKIKGVQEVVSSAKIYALVKNNEQKKFDFLPIISKKPTSQEELDSLKEVIYSQPLYDNLLYNKDSAVSLMMITVNKDTLNTPYRVQLVNEIKSRIDLFGEKHNIEIHYSGLPYIRTVTSKMVENELKMFIFLAMAIAALMLYFFFRSFKAMFFPIIIVIISVIWALGTISLLGYKITILTGIIPPLLIIIGVENCIFLLNKYHSEYKIHQNKVKALSRIVQRTGGAILLTNLTTAVGFATFIITQNDILVEFGIVASINIMFVFLLTLFLIPIIYSYIEAPQVKHIKHLDNKWMNKIIEGLIGIVQTKRTIIYIVVGVLVMASIFGVSKLSTSGNIVDDIPKEDKLYQDLLFFERHIKGIMPFEISINTNKKRGVMQLKNLKKIEQLQDTLALYPELSKPLSIVEVVKSAKQAFYNGQTSYYKLPNNNEMAFMASYLPKNIKNSDSDKSTRKDTKPSKKTIIESFVDKDYQTTRVSVQMANIGTKDIQRIKNDIQPKIDQIFPPDKYDVNITGTSVVFLKGSDYLVDNLITSLIFAILIIAILMAVLFTSARMILISIIPNLLPQFFTAALMGYAGITIKPSTILIFSIALGISVDNAIHFLSRYRQELKRSNYEIHHSVLQAMKDSFTSMIYSSVVLIFGFSIFMMSNFGGTEALGFLISFTLLVALSSNMFLLPAMLLSLNQRITRKIFKEPLIDIFDEEEDIDPNELVIEDKKQLNN